MGAFHFSFMLFKAINHIKHFIKHLLIRFQFHFLKAAFYLLQGYKLVEKNKNVSYTILKYEKPLILEKEVA